MVVDRGIALHKMIRLLTSSLSGEGYLNFMGNEFGHPEWIDFPREGNGWSFHYCRRQWSLQENGFLKYQGLGQFDKDMVKLTKDVELFKTRNASLNFIHEEKKVIAFHRQGLLFAFNFHPTQTLTRIEIPVDAPAEYTMELCTDDAVYGGQNLIKHGVYPTKKKAGKYYLELYLPVRTAVVLKEHKKKVAGITRELEREQLCHTTTIS